MRFDRRVVCARGDVRLQQTRSHHSSCQTGKEDIKMMVSSQQNVRGVRAEGSKRNEKSACVFSRTSEEAGATGKSCRAARSRTKSLDLPSLNFSSRNTSAATTQASKSTAVIAVKLFISSKMHVDAPICNYDTNACKLKIQANL